MEIKSEKKILSFKEALAYLDVSPSLLYKLTSQRTITYFKPNGGKIYFQKADLDYWMLQNENKSKGLLEEKLLTKIKSKKHE
ncbi:helix-turn-helix domain-containing protein [Chryseobacterium gallinarum]|uniref:helix-turn-helix domain-containing protein n=1 Tax=Chryseobacterium gallinarum TaxID=1324352 RepID=UPI0020241DDD|nr:helix-turn-helix domain-containing protein [Chryseobacterium gallinarum]MCL8536852.1 helix-turn-helix domain-containing protein [Chryseobacterium gallinarum]